MKVKLLAACFAVLAVAFTPPRVASATAPACVLPYTFTAGQTLPAAQLNADFAQAAACAGPVVYVDAYSPHGDGITPDDTAFNAAQNALPAGGGTIVLGNATYALTGPFLLKSNVTLAGQGPRASVIVRAGGTDNVLIAVTSVGNVTIRDLGITGVNIGTHDNIRVTSSANVKLDDVDSYQSKGNGVTFVTNTDDASATRSGVYNSRLYSNAGLADTFTGYGVAIQAVKHFDIQNSDIYGNYQGGAGSVHGGTPNENGDIKITGNRFSANVANGLYFPAKFIPASQTTTTASFTVPAAGSSVTVPLAAASVFTNGQTILVSDGTHTFTGSITSGGGSTSLVVLCASVNDGVAGATMASAAKVGYQVHDTTRPFTNGLIVSHNSFVNQTSGYAIQLPVWNAVVSDNEFDNNGAVGGGALVFQGRYLTITGNVVKNSPYNGIDIGNCQYVTVTGNQINNTGYYGIELGSTLNFTVSGNQISNVYNVNPGSSTPAGIILHDDTVHFPWVFFFGHVAYGSVSNNTITAPQGTYQQYGIAAVNINGATDVDSTVTVSNNTVAGAGSVTDLLNQTNARFLSNNDRNSGVYSVDQFGYPIPGVSMPAGFGGKQIIYGTNHVALQLATYSTSDAWLLFGTDLGNQDGFVNYQHSIGLSFGVQSIARAVLDVNSNLFPGTASTGALGKTGQRWANGYIDTLTLTNALGTAYGGTACTAVCWVDLTTGQTVAGIKTFSSPPVMSGASITSATIPNAALVNSTISGVNLGSSLFALTPPSHVSGGTYNGGSAVTWTLDATSANTASTIIARDGSGNFSAGSPTFNGDMTIAPAGTATSGGGFASAGGVVVQNSTWNGSAAVTNSAKISLGAGGGWNFAYNGGTSALSISTLTNAVSLPAGGLFSTIGGIESSSNSSTLSYVGPTYTHGGAAVGATEHHVVDTCVFSASTSCSVTLTAPGAFSSATSYSCSADYGSSSTQTAAPIIKKTSGTAFTITVGSSTSETVGYKCEGT